MARKKTVAKKAPPKAKKAPAFKSDITVIDMALEEITPNPHNPKKHFDEGIERSIEDLGYLDPIEVDEHGVILAGHGRYKALLKQGVEKVPVIVHKGLSDEQKKQYLLASNQLTMREGWANEILKENFDVDTLLAAGFDNKTIKELFKTDDGDDDFDGEGEHAKVKKPKAKEGDVYELGPHRIMCGDATSKKHMETLMTGVKADMIFTDPPYNVDYSGRGKKTSTKILNDKMTPEAFREFLTKAFKVMGTASKATAPAYICYASRSHREFEDALNMNGFEVKNQIIWVKSVASMGWGDYRWKHEPILYASRDGKKVPFFGDRAEYTTWEEELTDAQLLKRVKKMIDREEKGESTVWKLRREVNYDHPTQKPLQLMRIALWNSTSSEDVVLDPFLGGGSTLIAAEDTSRICFGMELDPKWIDVIIKRWEKQTGKKAVKV